LHDRYVCGLCNIPARAGKTRKAKADAELQLTAAA
jgi:flagellar transcriptional activator FlhC